jgi:phosphatidylserine/phosphatidylglycerophosphate/cardiolipin synthase-like enzyme
VTPSIEVTFLQDGAQPAERVAGELADFIGAAQRSLDIAIYDLNVTGGPADQVRAAIKSAAGRNVAVRLLYNVDFPNPIPVPPPSQSDTAFIASLGVPTKPVSGVPDLMHHKYIVRDGATDAATVWTGSMNWTNDSWTREENVILKIPSPALAAEYARNFGELPVTYQDSPVKAHLFFAPGRGRQMAHVIADRIAHARRRIRVCSPVITAGVVLGTLGDLAKRPHPEFKGVYDRTQMAEVLGQWRVDPHATWKGPAFLAVSAAFPFASKVTTPYTPTSIHDFMHAKITVVDNTVFTGSYNLSHAGEDNAENLLALDSAPLADRFVEFVDAVFARYAQTPAAAPK